VIHQLTAEKMDTAQLIMAVKVTNGWRYCGSTCIHIVGSYYYVNDSSTLRYHGHAPVLAMEASALRDRVWTDVPSSLQQDIGHRQFSNN